MMEAGSTIPHCLLYHHFAAMTRRRRTILTTLVGLLALGAAAGGYVIYAMNQVRPFYAKAIAADPQELKSAGRRM